MRIKAFRMKPSWLYATRQNRAVLTLNRRDFIRLHQQSSAHAGIVVTKDDADKILLTVRQTLKKMNSSFGSNSAG